MHILGLWHIQSLLISNNIPIHNLYYAAADVQRFQFLTYQWDKNGNCNEKIATMNVRVSFEDLIGLKGYSILNKAAASLPDITSVENKVNEICVGESGAIYECKINKFILKPLLNLKEPLPFEIYTGVKITHTNNPKSTFAEYDLLLFTKDLRIYIVEAKSGKSVMLKQIESQQKLATNWGGRFCDFSAVIPVLNKETLINSIERYKNKGIDLFAGPGSAKQDLIPLIKNYLLEKELIPEI
ncbi:MAG: hypothetical protein IPO63_17670 [Bacteroidetes bacterium]|nr:hypothetical protein [Bacteroidota bacterium]